MRILDEYIVKEFGRMFILTLFVCALILSVSMLFDTFEDIIENTPEWYYIVGYFLNRLPLKLIEALPIVVAVAVMFSVGLLAKNNETIAMFSSGMSELRVAAPLLIIAAIISVTTIYLSEMLVPDCEDRALRIEKMRIEGKSESIITKNKDIFVKGKGNRFYIMKGFDSKTNKMTMPKIFDLNEDGSSMLRRIDATSAVLEEGEQRYWRFHNATIWEHTQTGLPVHMSVFKKSILIPMEDNLEKFLSTRKEPEQMNFTELRQYIALLAARGEGTNDYLTDLMLKIAFPLSPIIITLIGFHFAARSNPKTRIFRFAVGMLCAIGYFIFTALFRELGRKDALPAILAAWLPNIVFAFLGVYFIWKSQRIRKNSSLHGIS